MTFDPLKKTTLTFDCYGTLVDWEAGILAYLAPWLAAEGVASDDEEILNLYGTFESEIEAGPYRRYREVLGDVVRRFGRRHGLTTTPELEQGLAVSVADWPTFEDTTDALTALAERFDLVVVSNIDRDLFAGSAARLGVALQGLVTAEDVGAYKPDLRVFEAALEEVDRPREEILHVAQSLFHDIAPARQMGLDTVWVNRRAGQPGTGATPPSTAQPSAEVPSLAALAALLL